MSHPTKDCLERPRSKGAKWTGKNIAADDKIEEIKLIGFESKRDRWNGFDAKDYSQVGIGSMLHYQDRRCEVVNCSTGLALPSPASPVAQGTDGAWGFLQRDPIQLC